MNGSDLKSSWSGQFPVSRRRILATPYHQYQALKDMLEVPPPSLNVLFPGLTLFSKKAPSDHWVHHAPCLVLLLDLEAPFAWVQSDEIIELDQFAELKSVESNQVCKAPHQHVQSLSPAPCGQHVPTYLEHTVSSACSARP